MIRSLRRGSALLVLALVGLAWGQPASSGPTTSPGRTYTITVQEPGRPTQVCKILKYWTEPDGHRAYQVEALDTGERMTILEVGALRPVGTTDGTRTTSTQVFRYGRSSFPPPGVPAPPADAVVLEVSPPPAPAAPPSQLASNSTAMPTAVPTTFPRPTPSMVQARKPVEPASPYGQAVQQPTTAATATPTATPAATRPATAPVTSVLLPPPPGMNPPTPGTGTASTTEKSADWRQSWGRIEKIRTNDQPAKPVPTSTPTDLDRPRMPESLPVAKKDPNDPLKQPAQYSATPAKVEKDRSIPHHLPAQLAATAPTRTEKADVVPIAPTTPAPKSQSAFGWLFGSEKPKPTPTPTPAAPVASKAVEPPPLPSGLKLPAGVTPMPASTSTPATASTTPPTTPTKCVSGVPCPTCPTCKQNQPCQTCKPCQTCQSCQIPATAGRLTPTPALSKEVNSPAPCVPCQPAPCPTVKAQTGPPPVLPEKPISPTPVVKAPAPVPTPKPTPTATVAAPRLTPRPAPTPAPTPALVPEHPATRPPTLAQKERVAPEKSHGQDAGWSPFHRPTPPTGMESVRAARAKELREGNQAVMVAGPHGRPLLVSPANAFGEPVAQPVPVAGPGNAFAGSQPIPADRIRKDLMPPELVAMLEGRYRPGKGPIAPAVGPYGPPQVPGNIAGPAPMGQPPMRGTPLPPLTRQPMPPAIQPVSANSSSHAVEQLRSVLVDDLMPSSREEAANRLARYDPYRTPVAVQALLTGALIDPAVTVRIACIRGLGAMRASTPEVLHAFSVLSRDQNEPVRTAAAEVARLLQPNR